MKPAPFLRPILLAVLVACLPPTRAGAHAFIDRADPAVGSTLGSPPSGVHLWFTEPVETGFSRLQVFDATGRQVDKKDVRVDPQNPRELSVSLPGPLGAGTYKVVWRAVSVDTHVTQGDFTFRVTL